MSLEASKNTSEQQYLMAIALGSDGVAQMGRAYQPGFGLFRNPDYDRKGIISIWKSPVTIKRHWFYHSNLKTA
ncbi:hypothetical protein [Psychrobacter sp. WY6]|uniref:hypothetical protein n=1 Tax=Psychrobacter sp. WY6 TaxID=2708350 RepID=UPI002023102C|nr:hypothetical protein [Psychrobacter sp. WY6]